MYAYFAGGCFWCIEPIFNELKGVHEVTCGYCGGKEPNPTYQEVKAQKTSHRETLRIKFDESIVTFKELLTIFFSHVDLSDDSGQYIDRGHSYTLAVYYTCQSQKEIAIDMINSYKEPVYVSIEPFEIFYDAEEYHQHYYLKNPQEFEKELIESGRKK